MDTDKILKRVLEYLDSAFSIRLLYYPGSGFHKVPKKALGIERVVHLSKEEVPYFTKLGEGLKVKGDFKQPIFKENSFDATLIWGIPPLAAYDAMEEFMRVTKDKGLLVVGSHELRPVGEDFDIISRYLDLKLEKVGIPFKKISVYRNKFKRR